MWPGSGRPWSGCSGSPQERGRRRDRASGAASEYHYAPAKIHVLCTYITTLLMEYLQPVNITTLLSIYLQPVNTLKMKLFTHSH